MTYFLNDSSQEQYVIQVTDDDALVPDTFLVLLVS